MLDADGRVQSAIFSGSIRDMRHRGGWKIQEYGKRAERVLPSLDPEVSYMLIHFSFSSFLSVVPSLSW